MFTGIIEAVGKVKSIKLNASGARVMIASGNLDLSDVKLGDSIATNGICLTVVDLDDASYSADVSKETLTRTGFTNYASGTKVNLEKAMLPTTRFGGHMVSGHVDGIGKITAINTVGNSIEYWIELADNLKQYVAEKGSITVDGTSLTVNSVDENKFRLTIVPHTTEQTIISTYKVGQLVNLEVDLIARYIERLLFCREQDCNQATSSGISKELLLNSGFIK
ncbi:riboflavin synthase [Thalassotalea sp. ND16A]|uniref:riboflavin synthase n=1 Tax=Thalassotalea sp. ND16A TaxID=1535422 RepID=UPI00051A835D|nr:riboflavin synthase [Thalassotalea sp. ND16A]KGK01058.1 Riboflavin synthase [Thalassotalea sp. ND16A]